MAKEENTKHSPQNLLSCLEQIAAHYNKPFSEEALIAGLAIEGKNVSAAQFPEAAMRAQLNAKVIEMPIFEINASALPAIVLTDQDHGYVITRVTRDGFFEVQPNDAESYLISQDELNEKYNGRVIAIKPASALAKVIEQTLNIKSKAQAWFWDAIKTYWPIYNEVLIASGFINLLALATPLFIMNVYDRVVPNDATETLWVLAVGVFIAFAFDFVLRVLRTHFIDNTARNIDAKLSAKVFSHLVDLKTDTRPDSVGHLVNTVQAFESFREFITSASITTLVDLPFVFIFIIIIAILGGSLALVPLILIPLVLMMSFALQKPLIVLVKKSFQAASIKQTTLLESLLGADTIKSVNAQSLMQSKWEDVVCYAANIGVRLRFLSSLATNISIFSQFMGSVILVIYGVYKIGQGDLTIGALIACTILTGRALAPMVQAASLLMRYYQSIAGIEGLDKVMALPTERPNDSNFIHPEQIKGKISFDHVTYTYGESTVPALRDVSFTINSGEHVAIIGRIGSGKSTILKLMTGLLHPTEGNILLDDINLQQYDPVDYRKKIGYVPQDTTLFNGSIKDNIKLGNPLVPDEDLLEAIRFTSLDKLISQQADALNKNVGERGQNLSGGQRQTIILAQAMLSKPDILLFDEPTKSMDDMTERHIAKNVAEYYKDKTFILVTHKVKLLPLVDRIILTDNGQIIMDGPKETVVKALSEGKVKIRK